ncbi:MAG: thioredoxin fold domain-containing protein [Coleofasciculus sp. S288]|nr:thioredoxin fold domain-containing protein [Coleofasciculus sp. S288]
MVLSVNARTFSREVLESPTPVLVDFWAPWCGLCRLIHPLVMEFQLEWGEPIKLVRVNADENLKLANTYRLKSLPTLILFEDGQVIQRLENFQGREDLRRALQTLMVKSPLPKSA